MNTNTKDNILDIEGVAKFLNIPVASAYKLAHAKKIPGVKVGKHWRFDKEEIVSWIKEGMSAKNKRKGEADTTDVGHGNKSNTEEPKEKDSLEGQFFADEGPYGICLLHNAITVSQILDDPTEVSKTIFPPGVIYEISNDANEKNKGLAVSIKFVLDSVVIRL